MAAIAGSVKSLSSGIFHVKDENGNIKVLQVGDTIYEKDTIYGDDSNTASSNIEIELSGNDVIVLSEGQKQLIDSSLIEKAFGTEELYFTREGLNLNPDEYRAQEDVVSDLRDAKFKDENPKAIDENAKADNQDSSKDVTDQETAEGEEEAEDETRGEAQFQARDGDQTNVVSDLRDATFRARTQNYIDRDLFKSESEDRLSFDNGSSLDSFNSTTPVTPTTPPRASASTRPSTPETEETPETNFDTSTTTPPTIIAQLSINDTTAYESEGYLVFTVTLDTEVNTDVTFSYVTSQITATSGLDYTDQSGTITIPQGSTSVTIRVPIADDYLSDSGETMKITVSNVVGNAEITKPVGIGTILDNSDSSNPANEPNGYEDTDTVYAIIEGPSSVNEGDTTTQYTVKLVDKDGNLVTVTEDTEVVVRYTNTTTQDGDTNYNNNEQITVTIPANSSSSTFKVDTVDDYLADNNEDFNLEIIDVENTGEFENVKIGDKEGNNKDVTTTIFDNSASNTPNDLSDDTVETDTDVVTIKLFAADENGNVLKDANGNYLQANETYEGADANYIAYAFNEGETTFNDSTRLETQTGTVDISFNDATATGGNVDFDSTSQTAVTIGEAFSTGTILDSVEEGSENYTVTIDSNSYSGDYESVVIDTSSVTTTLNDGKLFVKIEAVDSEANEGETLTYKLSIVNSNGDLVEVPAGKEIKVNLVYEGNTSNPATKSSDYTENLQVTISGGSSETTFTVSTIDDYYAEGDEGLKITIDSIDNSSGAFSEVYTHTVANGANSDQITTTGTIKDNLADIDQPDTSTTVDDPINGSYDENDTVYAIIEGPASVNEGDTTTQYTVKLVDKDGNLVTVTEDTDITIKYTNDTTENGDTEYDNNEEITVTITAGNSSSSFTVDTLDDVYKDDGETYNLEITDVENTGEFENVKIGDTDGNNKDVDTTIYDNTNLDTETDEDAVKIVLVVVTSATTTIADITNSDGTLKIDNTNSTPESGKLYYMAVAVDSEGKPLTTQDGTVDITYGITSDTLDNDATSGTDYDNTTVTNVNIGEVFEVLTNDDYLAEGDENFTVTISNLADTSYESPSIDTSNDTVTSTITDNPANDTTKDPQETPSEPSDPDNPTSGNSYGDEDTLYVKITQNDSVYEGNTLTHTITLVDKDGNPVTVAAGETITITLTYSNDTSEDADYSGSTKVTQVTITEGNSTVDVENLTIDDFVVEGNENYTLTITDVSQSNDTYENVAIDTNNNSVTGEIKDGVSLGVPDNATVDEDSFDVENSVTTISDTQSLNITAPNEDNAYTLSFSGTPTFTSDDASFNSANSDSLTSDGVTIEYVVSGNTITAYAGSGRTDDDKVFEITLNKNSEGGSDDNYTYTQYKNIDHPISGNGDSSDDDEIVLTFGYQITDQGQTSSVQNFTVTVSDSLPTAGSQDITLNEDSTKTIYISDESFNNNQIEISNDGGTTTTTLYESDTIEIYDNTSDKNVVGVLTNNGDGTLTFTPNSNYSGTTAGFTYSVSDGDGDTASGTVNITVNPIADKADMNGTDTENGTQQSVIKTTTQVLEDNNNASAEESTTDYTAEIGLILPQISDNSDYTTDAANDDQPEKLGLITLSSSTGSTIIANNVEYDLSAGSIQIYITDDPDNYHYSGIDTTSVVQLTQAQFEAIVVVFEKDDATNPLFTVSVDEYEVNDDDTIDTSVTKATNSQDYEVDILAVTDPVTLEWNSDTDSNSNNLGSYTSGTFTFDTVDEGYGTIDLKSLLTNTNGLETDSDGDLDGSEKRSYTITGIPEGTIVTLGGKSVAADSTGTVTIDFPDNTEDDPEFTMTIAEQFSGTISGTITLNVTDTDDDSTGTITTESATVSFTMTVNPVADQVTLKVAQAQGDEDAGRTNSNDENVDADVIDAPEDGIELYINVISDDNKDIEGAETTDEKEEYNVTISGIPDGGSLYVYDNSSSSWKLVTVSSDGTTVTIDGVTATSLGDITVDASADGTYSVTINDYQNDNLPKFIPPYNSDENYTFDISAVSYDAPDTSIAQTLQIDVTVNAVADIPVNDELATTTATDDDGDSNSFNLVSTEDSGGIDLKDIFSTPESLDSNDLSTGDGSETLTFKVTGLAEGFSISGATFIGGTGTDRIWLVDISELNSGNVTLVTPENFAGEVDFQVQFVTTEDAGDSKTHDVKDITVMVTPEAEGTVNSSDTQNEDEEKVLDFGFSTPDTDDETAGIESLVSFSIDMSTVPEGVTLVGSVSGTLSGSGYVSLDVTDGVLETVTAILTEDVDTDYSFNISYSYTDIAIDNNGNIYSDTKTVTDQLYSVTVNAITDEIALVMSTSSTDTNISDDSGHITVSGNGTFTKTLTVTGIDSDGRGNADTDGSEEFTRVTVSGVPEGITIVGGTYAGDTGGGNYSGYWYVDIPNEALDSDGATYDLVFDVDGNFDVNDLGDYTITVTAYNQEQNNDVEQSDSETFTLTIDTEITGTEPGIPATITAFYQDIDNDETGVNTTDSDHGYEVSTTTNTTITDSDAYEGSVVREDTQFKLSDVVYVETDTTSATSTAFSITIKNVPEGVEIEGMTLNSEGFYTISGSGNQAAIVAILQSILITPVSNANTDADDIENSVLTFDIELTTYASGGASNSALINFSASVLPVTDEMTLTVINDGQTNEDVAQTFSITLDNEADGVNTQIIDGKVYLQLTESYSDSQGTDGASGTLSYNGSIITATAVSGVTGLADGDYYVIEDVEYNDTLEFTYTPASNRDGTITVDVYVNNKESENWTSYDTETITTHKTISFTVDEVADGFTLNSGATISGTEDELVLLDISLTSVDSSESLSSVSLTGLPDGFLIYYGESSDGSDKVLANNLGVDGTTTIQLTYEEDETVDVNKWNIPLTDGQLPTYIWIQVPENWSGVIPDLSIIAVDENGNIYPETIASGTITPVVDSLTLNATQTFGKEGEDILLNLNANVEDLDGSETVTLTLSGFGDGDATFKASGDAITSSYDSDTDTYTIEGIDVDDINDLTVTHEAMSTTEITVTAKMVESNGDESDVVATNNTFDIKISESVASSGDDTLLLKEGISFDGLDGTDTLVLNGKTLDTSLVSNIEILDLDAGDNSISLTLDDVLDMTDSDNEITILGDSNDSLSVDTSGWTQGSVTDNGDSTVYEYTDGTNTVKLTVDENINTSGL